MAFNLEVLVVGQENKSDLINDTKIQVITESEEDILHESDRELLKEEFIYNIKGVWHTLGIDNDGLLGTQGLLETNFDKPINQNHYEWLKNQDCLENITPIEVHEDYLDDMRTLLSILIELSPVKMILLLARYQGGDTEIIQGPIPFDLYMEMLQEQKIPFNVYSLIKG